MGAVIAHLKSDSQKFEICVNSLASLLDRCSNDESLPDELLYGRSGYLYALLFVQKHCGKDCIKDSMLERVNFCTSTYLLFHGRHCKNYISTAMAKIMWDLC